MARKYELITELYRHTAAGLAAPQEWQRFLTTACRNFRLPFDEQVLVFAQRPDATAVLTIEGRNGWNQRFGRWVNRGATGIAVFDDTQPGRSRLKYYFDISDTHESRFARPVPVWTMRPEFEPAVIETLENSFGELADQTDLAAALLSAAQNAVEDHMPDYLTELKSCRENSFLEELDDLNIEVEYRQVLQDSIGYMLLVRCGIDPSDYFDDDDFRAVTDFNTPETLNALGVAAGDIGQMCLSSISRTVLALQRQTENEDRTFANRAGSQYPVSRTEPIHNEGSFDDERDHIHDAGRLQAAQPPAAPGAGNNPWEIRIDAPEVPEAAPARDLHEPADIGQAEPAPDGDRADGPDPDGAADRADGAGAGRDGGTEGQGSDEMAGPDERHPAGSGGDHSERADLQLTGQEPEADEVTEEADSAELPALLDDKLIMAVIANKGDDLKYKKQQIELYFSIHPDETERAEYLKSAYQDRYTEILVDGVRVGYKPQEDGLLMWEGAYLSRTSESVFSWAVVAGWTAQLIEKKEYFIQTRITPPKDQDSQQLSLFDFADFNAPAQDDDGQISFLPRPQLPQQIIDEALCIGANDRNSRLIICAYFMKDHSLEENAALLAKHYGENGAGFYVNDRQYAIWYNAEGIRIASGDTAQYRNTTLVTWEQAAQRIRELLDLGRYMPQSELDRVVDYERSTLAENLALTARDLSEEAREVGYAPILRLALSEKGGFPEIKERIAALLTDPEMLQKITEEWGVFAAAYAENRHLLRFRSSHVAELLEQLQDLQREPVRFTAAEDYNPQRRFFISTDEIDRVLRGRQDYRLEVYAFFSTHSDPKEREKYLKGYHGEYSGYSGGNDNRTYTGKGLFFSHGSITEPYAKVELNWSRITKRIGALIAQDRFLSEEDRGAMAAYEIRQLARSIHNFFMGAPELYPKPYSSNAAPDYWEGVQEVAGQLIDPARVEEIYQMMLPLWDGTPKDDRHYESRKTGLEAMQAYRDGTYSVFGLSHTLRTLSAIPDEKGVQIPEVPAIAPDDEKPQSAVEIIGGEPVEIHHLLAKELMRFYWEFDYEHYKKLGSDEDEIIESLEQQLHVAEHRKVIIENLTTFLDETDPEEEIAVDMALALERIQDLPDEPDLVWKIVLYEGEPYRVIDIHGRRMDDEVNLQSVENPDKYDTDVYGFIRILAEQADALEEAKQLINAYCMEVFDQEADYSDLSHVDLAFSATSDSEHTVEIFADLVSFRLVYQVDGETVREIACGDLRELNEYLSSLDFDEMVAEAEEQYRQGRIGEAETPAPSEPQNPDYHLLSRLKADCEYYLGAGGREEKHLWAGSAEKQIAKMRELYAALSVKPEWLTEQDIDRYERQMLGGTEKTSEIPAETERSDLYRRLAEQALRFYGEFEGSREVIGMGGTDEEILTELENRLHDPMQRIAVLADLQSFWDHIAPEEELAVDLKLFIEQLQEVQEEKATEQPGSELTLADTIATIGPFWKAYCEVKEENANKFVLIKLNDGYFSFAKDAEQISEILHLKLSERVPGISGKPVKVCFLPMENFGDQYEILGDTGVGIVLADWVPGEGIFTFGINATKSKMRHVDTLEEQEQHPDNADPNLDEIVMEAGEPAEKEQSAALAPPRPKRERMVFTTLHPEIPADQRRSFRITDPDLGHGTRSEKYAANVAAIRTLKQIEAEDRLATPEEQEILSRYVGWGGLADCFDERHGKYLELKSLTAFYTSPAIIGAMYQALSQMGFERGNILEPSCGVGNFIGMLPDSMAESKVYGVEIDSISGRIAQQLYQNSSIAVAGFEKVQMPDSFFDVAVGNVPFGDFKVLDRKYDKYHWLIHDYFFGKTLDKVRPGGIIAFVTSKGTMDKENSAVRKYLAQRADLIGAIRLPNNAFKDNAGTEVTSDILFLQKRDRMTDIEPDWVHLDTDANGIRMNAYFVQHPEMVLGEMVMESGRFGMDSACRAYEDADLSDLLSEAIQNLHAQITDYEIEELDEAEDHAIPADPEVRNFSFCIQDGTIYFRENSLMYPMEVSVTAENRIRGMIAIRDCARRVIEYQTEGYPDSDIQKEQAELNRLYDDYTKKYGLLSSRGNSLAFRDDSSYPLLCSLEVLDEEGNLIRKADMFTKRTIRPHVAVTSVDTASEALAVSISEKARVDMEYMSALSGKSEEELAAELSGVIFRDIQCGETPEDIPRAFVELERFPFVAADEYLSGNVRRKLRMARALYEVLPAEKKPLIARNIEALEAVQPVDLTAAEIGVRIGANWVPVEIYQQFMVETFGTSVYARSRIKILRSAATGQWAITEKNADRGNIKTLTTYGTKRMNAYQILEQTLNRRDVRVFDYVEDENGNKKPILNKKETAIAQDRQELIKQKFSEWIWKDIDRRELLCGIYNEIFNSSRPREYDGRHITFSGMNPEITLRPHQIDAIAHIMYGGNTLLAHEVGAGKTFEMVAAAMEMKRLGLCTKSLVVVPNHIIEQWAAEWLQLYPSANILVATKRDFERQNRRKFCARIATGDYDAIIIGHSQFEKIHVSVERQAAILQQQIREILRGIEDAKKAKAERYTVKQMERTRKSLEAKLAKLNDQSRKDDLVTFEELGVDRVFVDESHYFKNLFLATKMRNVGGIAQTEAQKSSDLFMKCRYLDEITGGRGVIFATGTPISNSMVELYTIQRYLQYGMLEDMGLVHFDDWASDFGETVTAIELSPEGSGYRAKTRFAKFFNLPELMAAFRQVADIQTADMLKLPVPKANFHTEVIKPSALQQEMIRGLAERAEAIRDGGVDPHVDNMLRITNDGRKLALDMRLIQPLAPDDPNGKAAVCARNVNGYTFERITPATQMVTQRVNN